MLRRGILQLNGVPGHAHVWNPQLFPKYFAAAATPLAVDGKLDQFGHPGQADKYALARPRYPSELLEQVRTLTDPCRLSVDVGCGSGQLTIPLADWSEAVIGVDRSPEQIRAATKHHRVTYHAGDAYELPVENETVDLLTIAQAMHWLDMPRFFAEVKRILRPQGTFAVLGYAVPRLQHPEMEKSFKHYYYDILGSDKEPGEPGCYWDVSRPLLDRGFAKTSFPFHHVARCWHEDHRSMALGSFADYLKSFSAYQTYTRKNEDPLPTLLNELRAAGNIQDSESIDISIPFFLITCRK